MIAERGESEMLDEREDDMWQELIQHIQAAWPGEKLHWDESPLELIVFAQGLTIFIVPFIGVAMFVVANDKKIMGNLVNGITAKIFGITGLIVLVVLAIGNFYKIFL